MGAACRTGASIVGNGAVMRGSGDPQAAEASEAISLFTIVDTIFSIVSGRVSDSSRVVWVLLDGSMLAISGYGGK